MVSRNGRQATKRSGEFPPNPKQWDAERNGLEFRSRFKIAAEEPLRPFKRDLEKVEVISTREGLLDLVDESLVNSLLGKHRRKWSGMTIPCEGEHIVIINSTHAPTRRNATLMEEFLHIVLKHKPSRVGKCPHTGLVRREYDRRIEVEAYHSAAAALVPYSALRSMVHSGAAAKDIAEHFEVSGALVSFRLKTCKLYRRASAN